MKEKDFENLVSSVRQAGQIRRGIKKPGRVFHYDPVDIKNLRKKLGKSQTEFAIMIGVKVGTLRNWEQGRRKPEGPARALLQVASRNPKAVVEALT